MNNFKNLKIWQKGLEIAIKTYQATNDFPKEERFGLVSQLNRSTISIPSNIAEGCSRSSNKDYHRFLEIALGSSFETETQLLIAQAVNLGNAEIIESLLKAVDEEQKMLISYMSKIGG